MKPFSPLLLLSFTLFAGAPAYATVTAADVTAAYARYIGRVPAQSEINAWLKAANVTQLNASIAASAKQHLETLTAQAAANATALAQAQAALAAAQQQATTLTQQNATLQQQTTAAQAQSDLLTQQKNAAQAAQQAAALAAQAQLQATYTPQNTGYNFYSGTTGNYVNGYTTTTGTSSVAANPCLSDPIMRTLAQEALSQCAPSNTSCILNVFNVLGCNTASSGYVTGN